MLGRVAAFLVYLAILYGALCWLTGRLVPTNGEEDLWFVAAIGLLAYSLFDAPFFVPPSQVVASGVPSALLLLSIDLRRVESLRVPLEWCRWLALALVLVTTAAACVAIALRNTGGGQSRARAGLERLSYRFASRFGDGAVMFTPPALLSIVGFHQGRPDDVLWLTLIWVALVGLRPVELAFETARDLAGLAAPPEDSLMVGEVRRIDSPNIVRVAVKATHAWVGDRLRLACLPDGRQVNVLPLFVQTQDQELVGTGLIHSVVVAQHSRLRKGVVYSSSTGPERAQALQELAGAAGCELVGFVVEESHISAIQFEVAGDLPLAAGRPVFCRQAAGRVYYQILDARTREESFEQNPRGTHIVVAAQLGILQTEGGFTRYDWLPEMNAPVFLPPDDAAAAATKATPPAGAFRIGVVPQFGAGVYCRFSDLVEFHTAILGVTGTGKTELAFDCIRQGFKEGVKVFCVDFTGEYAPRLADLAPQSLSFSKDRMEELQTHVAAIETGEYGAAKEKKQLEAWEKKVRPEVAATVDQFLATPDAAVGLFELPDIANTRATLRATELYLSAVFDWARRNRRKRSIVVVLEEAHTVVPETGFYGFDKGETQAVVGRISQIALQGRKYGVGVLLVSQRTALVSKTLLSQCNTVIAFALHDKTSLDYLESVFGQEHVRALPRIGFRQAIAYGKGLLSDTPILMEVPEDPAKRRASEDLGVKEASRDSET